MNKRYIVAGIVIILIIVGSLASYLIWLNNPDPVTVQSPSVKEPVSQPQPEPEPIKEQPYEGSTTTIGNDVTVRVPNGWTASLSNSQAFLAIMFARPNHIADLTYTKDTTPTISNGIASWSGLTEHFYIRVITDPSQSFNPSDHQEITSADFRFDDGTTGKRYLVSKHADEAAKWGGLLKDDVWYGRTYLYDKGGISVEAHLAHYPSTNISIKFFEKVIKSLTVKN